MRHKFKVSLIVIGLVFCGLLMPSASAIIWGSYPPLPYWHGSMGNHTVWTDGNYTNVNVTDNVTANYYYGNGSLLTGLRTLPSGGTLNHILKNSGSGTASWGTVTENAGALNSITTLGMNNQLTSTLAIGTSPFVVTSTTKVSNLNVDLLDDYHVGTSLATIPILTGANTWGGTQTFGTGLTITDGQNVVLSTTTGTKFGTGPTQKLGFWNAAPAVQQAQTIDMKDMLVTYGFYAGGAVSATPLDLDTGVITCGGATITGKSPTLTLTDTEVGHDDYTVADIDGVFGITNTVDAVNAFKVAPTGGITFDAGADNTYTLTDAENFVLGSSTGNKIGTSNTQKMGFWGATPIGQPLATIDLGTVLSNIGLRVAGAAYPLTTSGAVKLSGTTNVSSLLIIPQITTGTSLIPYQSRGSILLNITTNLIGSYNGASWRWR